MYVEVYVDEARVLEDLSDAELIEEAGRRKLSLINDETTDEDLRVLHEAWRYRGPEVALQKLSYLIYERLGRII
jgi:hypothetical protein